MLLINGKGFGLGNGLGLGLGKGNGKGNGTSTEKTNKEQFSEAAPNKIDEKAYGENTIVITVKDYNIYYNSIKVANAKELEEKILSVDDYEKKEIIVKDVKARMTAYDEVKGLLDKLNLKYNEQS